MLGLYFINTKTHGNKGKTLDSITACECNIMLSLVLLSEEVKSLHIECMVWSVTVIHQGLMLSLFWGPVLKMHDNRDNGGTGLKLPTFKALMLT